MRRSFKKASLPVATQRPLNLEPSERYHNNRRYLFYFTLFSTFFILASSITSTFTLTNTTTTISITVYDEGWHLHHDELGLETRRVPRPGVFFIVIIIYFTDDYLRMARDYAYEWRRRGGRELGTRDSQVKTHRYDFFFINLFFSITNRS
jgi:hypothetical protein